MKRRVGGAILAMLLASCSDFPRDAEGTLDGVRREGRFRVGLVAPSTATGPIATFLAGVEETIPARAEIVSGDAEPLLASLEEGQLDLVIGRFDKRSPWSARVNLGPALRTETHGKIEFRWLPVMRNGENGWIAMVEKEARDASVQPQ